MDSIISTVDALPQPPDEDAQSQNGSGISYHNTSWIVDDGERQVYRNQTIHLRGNLTINSTGALEMENVTIVFNCSHDGQYGIHVLGNGFLNITDGDADPSTMDDSSNITNSGPGGRIFFIVDPHANLRLLNSELHGCGYMPATANTYGLTLMANGSTIDGCTFSGNLLGIYCRDAQGFSITNCIFSNNQGIGAKFDNCVGFTLSQNTFLNCPTGLEVVGSDSTHVSDSHLSSCTDIGIRFLNSNECTLVNISSSDCGDGILIENSAGCSVSDSFISNCDTNIFADGSQSTTVMNSTLDGSISEDVKIANGATVTMLNSSFDHDSAEVTGSNSRLYVKWYLHIQVNDTASGTPYPPLENASVEVRNDLNALIISNLTDERGQVGWIEVTQFTRDMTQTSEFNPYKVKVRKDGYNDQIGYIDMVTSASKFFDLVVNLLPSAPTNLTPSVTHDQTPTVEWDPSFDPDDTSLTYSYTVGTTLGGTDILPTTETGATNFTVNNPLPYNTTLHIRINAKDPKMGLSPSVDHVLDVINHRPTPPVVLLTPSDPKEEDNITCTIVNQSFDIDEDPVDYSFRWYRDGTLQSKYTVSNTSAKSNILPFTATGREQLWRCEVSSADPWYQSYLSYAEVTVRNALPVRTSFIDDIVFEEDSVFTGLNLNDYFVDEDRYQNLGFTHQGASMVFIDISSKGDVTINATANWFGTETITFAATDGEITITDTLNITVTPVNDIPAIIPIPDTHKSQGEWFNTTITGQDLADPTDVLTYETNITDEISDLIEGVNYNFNNTTGDLSVLAENTNVGIYFIQIKVLDNHGGFASSSFKLTFLNMNDPPYHPTIISPTEEQYFEPEETLILKGICDDPDFHVQGYNEVLTFRWASSINGDLGTGELLLNVQLSPGNHSITLTVTDKFSLSGVATVNISVGSLEQDTLKDGGGGSGDGASSFVLGLIATMIIVMLLLVVFFLIILRKRKKAQEDEVIVVSGTSKMEMYLEDKEKRVPEKIEAPESKLELLSEDVKFDESEEKMYTGEEDIDFIITLGHEHFYNGEHTEAILQWQRALEKEPHREDIKQLIQKAAEKVKEMRESFGPESGEDLKLESLPEGVKKPIIESGEHRPTAPETTEAPSPEPPVEQVGPAPAPSTSSENEGLPPTEDVKKEELPEGQKDKKAELDELFGSP